MTTTETPDRGTVRCSCGRVWLDRTLAEARVIGREHDDSPWKQHIVTSPLFIGKRSA